MSSSMSNSSPSRPAFLKTKAKMTDDIFKIIQSSDDKDYLETLYDAIIDPHKFEKEINKKINDVNNQLKRKNNPEEIITLKDQMTALKKEKEHHLHVVGPFIKEIEFAKSPQEVNAHAEEINGHIFILLGAPKDDEENPIFFQEHAIFLNEWRNKFVLSQEKIQKKLILSLKKNIKRNSVLKKLKILTPTTEEETPQAFLYKVDAAINQLEKSANKLCEARINLVSRGDPVQKALVQKKYQILISMKHYAWISKNNFDKRYNVSTTFYSVASFCSACQNLATFARAIPGANLIADGIGKTFDFFPIFS